MIRFKLFVPSFTHICFTIITLFLFSIVETAQSADPQFEACEPRHCGSGPNISYPFWIDNEEHYCGLPDFNISCVYNKPVLKKFDHDYYVREIFYENNSLLIADTKILNIKCPYPLHRFSEENLGPFQLSSSNFYISLFLNCTSLFSPNDDHHLVSCISNSTHFSYAFLGPQLSGYTKFSENCQSQVRTPIAQDGGNYSSSREMGILLEWAARIDCSVCKSSGGRCGYNSSSATSDFLCFCSDGPYSKSCPDSITNNPNGPEKRKSSKGNSESINKTWKVVIGGGSFIVTVTISLVFFCLVRKKYSKNKRENSRNVEVFLKSYGSHGLKRYSYIDLKKMTNSFREKLGQGGCGVVYKGKLLDNRLVAVKVLSESKGTGEEFVNEVGSIGRTKHVNIVNLLGFCFERCKRALIYEFMPNGSLEKFIYTREPRTPHTLGWEKLYNIAVGTARGLEYLHRGCNTRILHFDIKPHNILLDEDFCPKISDFGLAKLCPTRESTISMVDARGTLGYTAPEVFCRNIGGVSYKSDVYSYGMTVLEMVGGRKNIDIQVENTSKIYFPRWIYKRLDLDEDLGLGELSTEVDEEVARKMILVGLWCIQTDPANRPSMSRVVEMLEGSLEGLQMPPPFLSSPARSGEITSTA